MATPRHPAGPGGYRLAFMISQLGGLAASRFARRLAGLNITPIHAGVLRLIATDPGRSQQSFAMSLGVEPAKLVAVVDELEARGLVDRLRDQTDSRLFALHLTKKGEQFMGMLASAGAEHERDIVGMLTDDERREIGAVLEKIAEAHGLVPGGGRRMKPTAGTQSPVTPESAS